MTEYTEGILTGLAPTLGYMLLRIGVEFGAAYAEADGVKDFKDILFPRLRDMLSKTNPFKR
jgi:hypothetical protein